MVSITKKQNSFIFEVKGMHKLWAFKNQLIIPAEHILKAYQDEKILNERKGLRFPGTYIPAIITAGTFIKEGHTIFWDVSNNENCIIVDLNDEDYKRLIIEVENPEETINMLTNK